MKPDCCYQSSQGWTCESSTPGGIVSGSGPSNGEAVQQWAYALATAELMSYEWADWCGARAREVLGTATVKPKVAEPA
jgi:hypothetical protein